MVTETLIINFIGIISKTTLPITLSTGVLIFLPTKYLDLLKLSEFRSEHITVISLLFIICIGFHFSVFIRKINKLLSGKVSAIYKKHKMLKYISKLTEKEKKILFLYISENTQTLYLSIESGVVRGLELKGIILRVTNIGDAISSTFAYNIQPYIYNYLVKHKERLS